MQLCWFFNALRNLRTLRLQFCSFVDHFDIMHASNCPTPTKFCHLETCNTCLTTFDHLLSLSWTKWDQVDFLTFWEHLYWEMWTASRNMKSSYCGIAMCERCLRNAAPIPRPHIDSIDINMWEDIGAPWCRLHWPIHRGSPLQNLVPLKPWVFIYAYPRPSNPFRMKGAWDEPKGIDNSSTKKSRTSNIGPCMVVTRLLIYDLGL